ncbi:MAG: TIGR02147 family protein, partial [Fibrobacter sp.]|nr:TIGR02147 family protein [Fibrobacter sp.]
MLNIDEISDYRDLLKNYYTQRKLEMPLYSYKMLGQKLSLETSQVFRVLNKELHLPNRSIPLAKDLLDLKGRSGEIFEILVAASKTKSPAKKDKLYKMALALQDVDLRKFNPSEYLFLSKWWIPVVRALIEMNGGHAEVSRLVKQITPTVSEDQVREAIKVLKDLKLITPLASERYAATTANFTSG